MSDTAIQLIVGLGNPGPKYAGTRHNAGFWLVDALAADHGGRFVTEAKFFGESCRISCDGHDVRLLKPTTFMNESGRAVQALAGFFKIPASAILVAYDEIDLPAGKIKLKKGGGHGGHNGMRDLLRHMGPDFVRLRIGIGHPGHKDQVSNYVLSNPSRDDEDKILEALNKARDVIPVLLGDGLQKATHELHSARAPSQQSDTQKPPIKATAARKHGASAGATAARKQNATPKNSAAQQPAPRQGHSPAPPGSRKSAGKTAAEPQPASLKDQLLALLKRKK